MIRKSALPKLRSCEPSSLCTCCWVPSADLKLGGVCLIPFFPPMQKPPFADGSCVFPILLLRGVRRGSMTLPLSPLLTDISFLHWLRGISGNHGRIHCRSPEGACCSAFPSFLLGNTPSAPRLHTTEVFRSLNVSKERN